jgi:ribosomal protein S25
MKYVVLVEQETFFASVIQWCKKLDSVKDAPHARRPKTSTSPKMVEKLKDLIATDARFTTRYIAKCVGISVGAARTILRSYLKMGRISARWKSVQRKKKKTCSGKNLKAIVETIPQIQQPVFCKYHDWRWQCSLL